MADCASPPPEFSVLCEAVDLIERHYLDPVPMLELAGAAATAVAELDPTSPKPGLFACGVPDKAFLQACETIDERDLDPAAAAEAMVAGIANLVLDPNSVYLDPEALTLIQEEQSGTVEGIGALVASEDRNADDPKATPCATMSDTCRLVIVSPLAGSPAAAVGVKTGDELLTVDGHDIRGMTIDEVTALVRGPAGTRVRLEFDRGGEVVEFTIVRAAIDIPVVEVHRFERVGYIRLTLFTENAGALLRAALSSLVDEGIDDLVFDLRDNPGGALDAAVDVASEFVESGTVLRTIYPDTEEVYRVEPGGLLSEPKVRLVVLVNRGSASASEVVAGMLAERGRATIVGESTFGKNTVQQRFGLSNGGALKLTIAKWVTPGGADFGDAGVAPDIELMLDPDLEPSEVVDQVLEVLD